MSGQLRTGISAIPGVLRFVGDLAHDVDWFIHTWDRSQQKQTFGGKSYPHRTTEPWMIQRMIEAYQPRAIRVDDHAALIASLSLPGGNGCGQWVAMHLCDVMRRDWCRENNTTHDVVIRLRPDMIYSRSHTLASWIDIVKDSPPNVLWSAISNDYRVDDVIWATRPDTMTQAVGFWTVMQGRGSDIIHPPEFISYLASHGIEAREGTQMPHDRLYAPIREESQDMDPLTEVGRIFATDLMLYSTVQQDSEGRKIPTQEWLRQRSSWLEQL